MANREKGEASLKLPTGETLTLVMDNNALCDAEEASDKGADELIGLATRRLSAARTLLWASLRRHHPEKTLADCGTMFDLDREATATALRDALQSAFGQPEEEEAGNAPVPAKRTGKRS